MLAFKFSEFPALNALKAQPDFLSLLRKYHPDRDDYIYTASLAVRRMVFQTRDPNRIEPDALDSLLKRGYSTDEICLACAQAFFEDKDAFSLQPKGLHYRYFRSLYLALYANILAIFTLIFFIKFSAKVQGSLVATMLVFEPILALVGILLTLIYFYVLRWIVRLV